MSDSDIDYNISADKPPEPENIFPDILPVFLLIGVTFIMLIVIGGIAMLLGSKTGVFLSEIIIIIPALVFAFVARAPLLKVFRLKIPSPKIIASSILVALGVFVLADQLDRLIMTIFPMQDVLVEAMEEMLTIHTLSDGIIIIFSAVIVAGLCEEMLFRGIFQGTRETRWNATIAVWISSCLFAFMHMMPWTIIQILLLALVLGYMALKSGSILPSVIINACNNLFSITLMILGAE